jgi:hypothetical protein
MSRDRDVRNAIVSALQATGAFDDVNVIGLPESAPVGASSEAFACVQPQSSTQEDRWDNAESGALIVTSRVTITFAYRHIDPQLRDEGAELLFNTAANALNGQELIVGFNSPELSRFSQWTWLPQTPPERRIVSTFSYVYIVPTWTGYDTTP